MAEELTRKLPSLKDALSYFTDESASTKVRGNVKLQLALEGVEQHAQNKGLSPDNILSLTVVITRGQFADSTNSRLVRSLIPATTVPEDAAVRAISWICTNKPSKTVQAFLLRWLVLVYDLIDGKEKLHALYGVLFLFIQSDVLCPHVCHLLYLLTRKQDVRLFRVRTLLDLQTRVGVQPHLTGLLSLYKLYRPDLVNVPLYKTHRIFFKQTDKAWAALIRQVQLRNCPREERDQWLKTIQIPNTNILNNVDPTKEPRPKKAKLDCIPAIGYPGSLDLSAAAPSDKVPVQLIGSFEELLKNLDNLEMPSQAAAVLRSQYLQHFVSCHPQQHVAHRIGYWLYRTLRQDLIDCPSPSTKPRVEKLLKALIDFTDFLQEGVPLCEMFLWEYLFTWNGLDHRPQILQLITRSRLHPFQRLNDYVLEPLRRLYFTSKVHCKCQILSCLTELLRNCVSVEWARFKQTHNNEDGSTSMSLFPVDNEMFPALQSIQELVCYVDRLCVKYNVSAPLPQHVPVPCGHMSLFPVDSEMFPALQSIQELVCNVDRLCNIMSLPPSPSMSLFPVDNEMFPALQSIQELVCYVDRLMSLFPVDSEMFPALQSIQELVCYVDRLMSLFPVDSEMFPALQSIQELVCYVDRLMSLFPVDSEMFPALQSIQELVCYVDRLSCPCSLWTVRCSQSIQELVCYVDRLCQCVSNIVSLPPSPSMSLFPVDSEMFPALQSIQELVCYVDRLCVVGLQQEEGHAMLMHYTLGFFELATQLQRRFDLPLVHAPSAPIVYMAMFDTNALTVARICAIMQRFREEVTALKQKPPQEESCGFTSSSIRKFNNCILDICDALWRCKAFSGKKDEASIFNVPRSLVKQAGVDSVGDSFSLYNHIALQGFAHSFLQKSLPPGTPITPRPRSRQSTQDRSSYLDFLTSQGLEGIQGFISSFIKMGKSTPGSSAPSTASSTATSGSRT
ncbi:CENPI [Branchiostoma lanceolatum]|uniref:CENPI protein n=1 Tax=Branchiostoma lanceolatum TaxID=7740 RepID=A0A8K0EC15_BRALA|nr:CENPI [Branchiostoma lanceolatum]